MRTFEDLSGSKELWRGKFLESYGSGQTRVLKLMNYRNAKRLVQESAYRLPGEEEIETRTALSRVVLEDIDVPKDKPEFDVAAIDGYALSSARTATAIAANPVSYEVVGRSFPGQLSRAQLFSQNQALYVACGAPIPSGADCVVKVEHVKETEGRIHVFHPVKSSKNIFAKGEDLKIGTRLFSRGHFLRPQDIGAILSIGQTRVKVARRPVVGVLSIGSELTDVDNPKEGLVIIDHAYTILGFLQELGVQGENLGVCDDNSDNIGSRLKIGLGKCDMVVTMGGCSVGVRDTAPEAINGLPESRLLFHGLRLSPGKVTGMFIVNEKPVVMLAGHITTAISGFFVVVTDIIQNMMHISGMERDRYYQARLSEEVKTKQGMARFLLARVHEVDDELVAMPFGFDTNLFSTLTSANSYSVVSEDSHHKAGDRIRFYPLNQLGVHRNGSLHRSNGT